MKKIFIVLAMLFFVSSVNARVLRSARRPLIEVGPKTSLYISKDFQIGIGVETVFNPLKSLGIRLDLTEVRFGSTTFYLNQEGSLDALFYYPMKGRQTYFYSGFGIKTHDTGAGSKTHFSIRGGLGLNHPLNPKVDLFVEPGIIISSNGDNDVMVRLSVGGRFGILR